MQNLDLDKSANNMYKALIEPIGTITSILRRKLKGSYSSLHKKDLPKEIQWTTGENGNFTFPGVCVIESINKNRSITISIRFYWGKWKKKIYIGTLESKNPLKIVFEYKENLKTRSCSLSMESVDDIEFIKELKSWLKDKKTIPELDFGKWEK